jgi:molybdopterin converting factor small subunit
MVKVRLFGLLPRFVANYDPTKGIDLDIREGTIYRDLADTLQLPPGEASLFTVSGILKRPYDAVCDGEEIHIFMPVSGG